MMGAKGVQKKSYPRPLAFPYYCLIFAPAANDDWWSWFVGNLNSRYLRNVRVLGSKPFEEMKVDGGRPSIRN